MPKKKKKNKETTIENFYDLKVEEMDELVAALKGESNNNGESISYNISECIGETAAKQGEDFEYKKSSSKEFNPYKLDKLSRIPAWIKAFFIKFWFAGCVYYLIGMGLGSIITNDENRVLLIGIILGIVVDVLVNPALRYFQSHDREYDPYMMFPFPFKKYWTFFTNIIYYILIAFLVGYLYQGLNLIIGLITSSADKVIYVGVEPLLFGVFCVIVDMIFIGIKDLVVFLVKRSKKNKDKEIADV